MPHRILDVQVAELQPRKTEIDLVARVDADEQFRGLREEYYSWLWCLLSYRDIDTAEHRCMFWQLLRQLRLFQCPADLAAQGVDELPRHPAFRPSTTPTEAIGSAFAGGTLDHVALMACAFRLEFERLNLLAANDYLVATRIALQCSIQRLDLPESVAQSLSRLVELRALRRDWEVPNRVAMDVPRRIRSRHKQQQRELLGNVLGNEPPRDPVASGPSYPIVLLTPVLEQFLERAAKRRIAQMWDGP